MLHRVDKTRESSGGKTASRCSCFLHWTEDLSLSPSSVRAPHLLSRPWPVPGWADSRIHGGLASSFPGGGKQESLAVLPFAQCLPRGQIVCPHTRQIVWSPLSWRIWRYHTTARRFVAKLVESCGKPKILWGEGMEDITVLGFLLSHYRRFRRISLLFGNTQRCFKMLLL